MHATTPPDLHPQSFWAATADSALAWPRLIEDTESETVIIGAGFTGLSAAYRLAATGRSCLVIEAKDVGWGASGRNGGMVVPRYKHTFAALAARYGTSMALAMYRAALRAVDLIEQIVAQENIACDFSRCGHITPVVHARDAERFATDARWLEREAGDRLPRMLERGDTARRIGTRFYTTGYLEPRGGSIHPLRFCQGLARAVSRHGGRIFTHTPALSWRHDGSAIIVQVPGARISARRLLFATNGYADLERAGADLKRRIIPVTSSLIATRALDDRVREGILPLGNVVTDAKRLTNYFRISPDGRMIFGGRGGASNRESARIYQRLATEMGRIFPQLEGAPIEYQWSGRVAVTLDGLPHVGKLADNVFYAMGYNGRGVALSVLLGEALARFEEINESGLGPLSGALEPIPFHALQLPGKKLVTSYYRILDALGR